MDEVRPCLPPAEAAARRRALQEALEREGLDGAILLGNVHLFYFCGTVQDAFLWVPASGPSLLAVRKSVESARKDGAVDEIVPLRGWRAVPEQVEDFLPRGPLRLGMEFDRVPVALWERWKGWIPRAEWRNVSPILRTLRAVKSPLEQEWIRRAGKIVTDAVRRAPELFCPGMAETELSTLLLREMRLAGHPGLIRARGWRSEIHPEGAVSSGESACIPWAFDGPVAVRSRTPAFYTLNSDREIGRDEPVLVDMPGAWNGYHYDVTRTFVWGRLSEALLRAHETAVAIRDRLLEGLRPGAVPEVLYEEALERAAAAALEDRFMGLGGNRVRFVGHGIGLELDETPVLARGVRTPLREGMVLALEPKFFFPGAGGVGVEDTARVTNRGGEILSPLPDEVILLGR